MFRKFVFAAAAIAVSAALLRTGSAADDAKGESLFNGKDTAGWDGDPALWSVDNGELVGKHEGWKKANTFLCTKEKYSDFELTISFKLVKGAGNSGVQFRSKVNTDAKFVASNHAWSVSGYQADIDGGGFLGCCYEERGRGVLAHPNAKTKGKFPGLEGAFDALAKVHKKGDWNTYVITCQGDKVTQVLNGVKTVEFTDPAGAKEGIIALQLHGGGPMEIRFKDISIRKLAKN
jgi:hypothetical protein